MPTAKFFARTVFICLLFAAGYSSAQESGASVSVTPLKVEGLVIGNRYVIDEAFSQEHSIPVPQPFEFLAPTSDEHKIYIKPAPGGTGIFKVFFTTKDDLVKSNIQFVPITVGLGPIEERLEALPNLVKRAFVSSIPDKDQAEINVIRATQVGPYPAIEAIGKYLSPTDGVVVLRVVAIPHPDSINGLVVVINALPKNVDMAEVGDILKTDASRSLGTLKFQ